MCAGTPDSEGLRQHINMATQAELWLDKKNKKQIPNEYKYNPARMNVIEWNKLKRLSSSANRRPSRKSTAGIFQYNPTDVLFFFSHCGTKARDRCSNGELNPDCLTVDAVFVNNGATFSLEFSITFEKRITPWHAKRILAIATVVLSVLFDFFFLIHSQSSSCFRIL